MKRYPVPSLVDGQALRRVRVSDQVLEAVINDIRSGKLRAGDRLPTEITMAKALGVGRSSVREAISALEVAGILEAVPRRGTTVVAGVASTLSQELSIEITYNMIRDFYELRIMIECECARRAALQATEEQKVVIRSTHDRVVDLIKRRRSWFDANTDFHLSIARASGNVAFVYALKAILKSYRSVREAINKFSSTPIEDMRDHNKILAAIEGSRPAPLGSGNESPPACNHSTSRSGPGFH